MNAVYHRQSSGNSGEQLMHTKDMLADALRAAGLTEMADKAALGYYHDFLSPLALPELQLDSDLVKAIQSGNVMASVIRERHHNGEFDASKEESDEWMNGPEGQAAMRELGNTRR
jgi:hypothetical protein